MFGERLEFSLHCEFHLHVMIATETQKVFCSEADSNDHNDER